MFSRDTKKVFAVFKELTVGADANTSMKGKSCAQEAMLALNNNYNGKSEG